MTNYRIVRINLARSARVNAYWADQQFSDRTYQDQLDIIRRDGNFFGPSWSSEMKQLGNSAADLLIDVEPLQRTWSDQQGLAIDFSSRDWMRDVLIEQLRVIRPDVIYIQGGAFQRIDRNVRRSIRENVPSIKFVAGFWGDELTGEANYGRAFSGVDCVFAASRGYQTLIRNGGIRSELLGWGFDPGLVGESPPSVKGRRSHEFVFVGNTGYGCDLHRGRYEDLMGLMRKTDLRIWADESITMTGEAEGLNKLNRQRPRSRFFGASRSLSKIPTGLLQGIRNSRIISWRIAKIIDAAVAMRQGRTPKGEYFLDKEPVTQSYPDRCYPGVYGAQYYELIRQSRFVLNRHRDELADGPNIRVFEVTGLGSCLVTDRSSELRDFFEPDKEFVGFSHVDEAVEKIDYLCQHSYERDSIARAAAMRVQREHTMAKKCEQIDMLIQHSL